MSSTLIREREQDEDDMERYAKRTKVGEDVVEPTNSKQNGSRSQVLPPSHSLLGIPLPVASEGEPLHFREADVGIFEYIGRGDAKVEGIIKQRFTDFLVFEINQEENVIHLRSIDNPDPSPVMEVEKEVVTEEKELVQVRPSTPATTGEPRETDDDTLTDENPWPERFNAELSPYMTEESILHLKAMFLEGAEPPRISDSGWSGRTPTTTTGPEVREPPPAVQDVSTVGRGKRKMRGGGRGGRDNSRRVDSRKVLSNPIDSKEERTSFHKLIKQLFGGKLDTETDTSAASSDEGCRIVIKWAHRDGVIRSGRASNASGASARPSRGNFPPYIHFTLQKTNRDTQDALGHLSRLLHVSTKDLSVAGTKDKRGVTTQRVSLVRRSKTVEEVWRQASGISGRKPAEEALKQRGERGIRIGDFNYRKASLELGMLKGNAFVITLRNVKFGSMELLDEAMNTIKTKGFINYYGMQRFGTASVPTHSIGLALLQSNWQKAVDLIMQKRFGEHPDVEAARDAWLVERDLDKALRLFPRRVVAERCLLESFKKQKGDTRNAMGALSTIPKNLRLMYIHAYQSYVWNAIVSERIKTYGSDRPIIGDIVFDKPEASSDAMDVDLEEVVAQEGVAEPENARSRKPYVAPKVRTLTEEDLDKYSIFDVIMPLPGTSVAYPGGALGERYRDFLRMDGLDPDNFVRKQREYTLNGSYRTILHLPKELSWSVLRYTDPDVSLAQSDEDKLLGFDPPAVVNDGKFLALQISLKLGTAAYATMALREITKTDTSSHVQTGLTQVAEDQKYRGGKGGDVGNPGLGDSEDS